MEGTIEKIYKVYLILIFSVLGFSSPKAFAQELPPVPIKVEVRTSKFLDFGSFTSGTAGGTVTVDHGGIRNATGDVFLLDFGGTSSAALFDLTANQGTIITIQPTPIILLEGSNGGSITLEINSFSTGPMFITTALPPNPNEIYVGGTLLIGSPSESPAGEYNGIFNLTFIHE